MTTIVHDMTVEKRVLAERAASGADRFDEVWEGIYVMAPMPNDEHQQLVSRFTAILQEVVDWQGLGDVRPGVNVSDRQEGWTRNFRVPDVAVFLKGGAAVNCNEFWWGGPDFVIEVVSPDDQSREKLPFYSKIKVRELMLVNRSPWQLELFRLKRGDLQCAHTSTTKTQETITSTVVPLQFQLSRGKPRPVIVVRTTAGDTKEWAV